MWYEHDDMTMTEGDEHKSRQLQDKPTRQPLHDDKSNFVCVGVCMCEDLIDEWSIWWMKRKMQQANVRLIN